MIIYVPFLLGLSDAFIGKVADRISKYFKLGIELGVDKVFLDRLEDEFPKDNWRATLEMLCKWRDISPHRNKVNAMVNELITALRKVELNNVADIVKDGKCVG